MIHKAPAQPNQSLLEGIEVLLAVAKKRKPSRVRELARELGMTPTRLQRYLATLAYAGLTLQNSDRSYSVGAGIHALSAISLSASGLASRAMVALPSLSDLNCLVALGVLWRKTVSYLYFSKHKTPLNKSLGREEDYPAKDSGIGLVLLATWSDSQIKNLFGDESQVILQKVQRIRDQGYSYFLQNDGTHSLAITVGEPVIAGLAMVGNISKQQLPVYLDRMKKVAHDMASTKKESS